MQWATCRPVHVLKISITQQKNEGLKFLSATEQPHINRFSLYVASWADEEIKLPLLIFTQEQTHFQVASGRCSQQGSNQDGI